MGAWRALMISARARIHLPFLLTSSLHKQKPSPIAPFASFESLSPECNDACRREAEQIWPGLGLGLSVGSHNEARQDAEALLEDAKEFLQAIKNDLGRLDLGTAEYRSQPFGHRFHAGEQRTLAMNAGASIDIRNLYLQSALSSNQDECDRLFSTWDATINAPGFHGSKEMSIQADSVKRKRKKKMNKHKHRKLRRLARKSRK